MSASISSDKVEQALHTDLPDAGRDWPRARYDPARSSSAASTRLREAQRDYTGCRIARRSAGAPGSAEVPGWLRCNAVALPREPAMFRRSTTLEKADPELWTAIAGGEPAAGRPHRADRVGELREPRGHGGAGHRSSPTSTPRATRASATTAAASSSTSPSSSRSTARRSSSTPTPPTCSRTPARRPTRRCSSRRSKPGDTILGMSLPHGGHLTHGSPVNVRGKWFNVVAYGLDRRDRAHRLRRGGAPRARAQAEAHHRRRVGVFARHRLEALSRRSPTAWARS